MRKRNSPRSSAFAVSSVVPETLFERLEERTLLSADLTVSIANAPATLTASLGGVINLTGTVRNLGDIAADGFVTRLALSRDTTYDPQDTLLSYILNHGTDGLSPGESFSLNRSVVIPAGLAPGAYYVVAVTDFNDDHAEGNEENNAAATARPTVILNGPSSGPNLTATVVVSSTGGVNPEGGTFSAVATLRNTVAGQTVGAFRILWVLSRDSVIGNSDDLVLREQLITPVTGFGGSVTMTVSTEFELDEWSGGAAGYVEAGSYRVGVVVDHEHVVSERNEADNRAVSSRSITVARPDLTGTITYTGGTISPGESLRVTLTLRNLSVTAVREGARMEVRVLLEPAAGGDAIEILRRVVLGSTFQEAGLSGGETRTLANLQVPLPFTVAPGAYRVRLVVDSYNQVDESNEGNNSTLSSLANVVVPPRNMGNDPTEDDIRVWGARVSGTYAPGGSVGITLIGSNLTNWVRGNNFRLMLSTDHIPSDDDIEFVSALRDAPDEWDEGSGLHWGSAIIPLRTPAGVYHLLAVVDEDMTDGIHGDIAAVVLTGPAGLTVAMPTVSVAAVDPTAAEGTGSATTGRFRFTRTGPLTGPLTVYYFVEGSADAGSDYTGIETRVTFPAGARTVTVDVTALDDAVAELAESVVVTIDWPKGSGYVRAAGAARTATVTIADNEPTVRVAATDARAAEPGGTTATRGVFTFTRSGGSTAAALNVYYTVGGTAAGGADYQPLSGTVTIPAGATTVTLFVAPIDDPDGEGDETVVLSLSAHDSYRLPATTSQRVATVTIADNEPLVRISVLDAVASERPNPVDRASFRISRDGPTVGDLVVAFGLTGGMATREDFTLGCDTEGVVFEVDDATGEAAVTIPAGRSSVTVYLYGVLDNETEPQETVVLGLLPASGPGQLYRRGATTSTATARINSVTYADLAVSLDALTLGGPTFYTGPSGGSREFEVRYTNRGNTTITTQGEYLFLERANGSRIRFGINAPSYVLTPGQTILVTMYMEFTEEPVTPGTYRVGVFASTFGDGQPLNNTAYWTTPLQALLP